MNSLLSGTTKANSFYTYMRIHKYKNKYIDINININSIYIHTLPTTTTPTTNNQHHHHHQQPTTTPTTNNQQPTTDIQTDIPYITLHYITLHT